MELLQLKYFCDAAERENFSKTAEKYQVPPSNISQTVRRLEKELGVRLFIREANQVRLNEQGKAFYKKAKAALELISEATAECADTEGELRGEIKILIQSNRRIVTSIIESFRALYPQVSFIINHTLTDSDTSYDFVISDREPKGKTGEKRELLCERIMIGCHKSSRFAGLKHPTLVDLKDERFISMTQGTSLHGIMLRLCEEAGITPNVTIQSDDPHYIRKYLDMGMGIAVIPAVTWRGLLSDNTVLRAVGDLYRRTYVFCQSKQFLSSAKRRFLDALTEGFKREAER